MRGLAEEYTRPIVRFHDVPRTIVSSRDGRFTSKFRAADLDCLKMSLHCTTAYHLHTDGQSMRTLQILEVMLRDCVLNWEKVWTGMWYTVMLNEPSTVNG